MFADALDAKDAAQRKGRKFSKWFQPYLDFLQRFSGVVDTAIQSKLEVAALIWAGAKLVITVRTMTS